MIAYDIPQHWQTLKLRQILRPYSEKNHPELPLLSVVREKGVIVRNTESKEENHNYIPEDLSGYKRVKAGQFAMNKMKAWQGSYGISKYEGIVSPAYFVFDVITGMNLDFFNLAIRSKVYVSFFGRASDGIRVGQWDLSIDRMKEIPFFVPPREEQDQIVRFLDWKVSEINRLINIKRKEIERLEELKKAVVSHAVTRGLVSSVTMKDSGVSWIGKIPAHWKLTKVKRKCRSTGSGTTPSTSNSAFYNGSIAWIQSGDLYKTSSVDKTEKTISNLALQEYSVLSVYNPPYLVLAMYGASIGNTSISNISACVNQACCVLIPTDDMDIRFMYYWLTYCKDDFIRQSAGGTQPNISQKKVREETMIVPPIDEQQAIAEYLESECKRIAATIENKLHQIEQIQEFKTRLISDVVTGKIDVRGIEIPEYEYTAEEADSDSEAEELDEQEE